MSIVLVLVAAVVVIRPRNATSANELQRHREQRHTDTAGLNKSQTVNDDVIIIPTNNIIVILVVSIDFADFKRRARSL